MADLAPSTMAVQTPTWLGQIQSIGGSAYSSVSGLFTSAKQDIVDPVEKDVTNFTSIASGYVERTTGQAQAGFFNTISSILTTKNDLVSSVTMPVGQVLSNVGSGLSTLGGNLSSGLKWGIAVVIIGLAIYTFLLASPFLPKPGNRNA